MSKWLRRAAVACALASGALGLSCGDDPGDDMTREAAIELRADVQAVRATIEAGDLTGAQAQLAALRTTVVELTTTGAITQDRAVQVNGAIAGLEQQLTALAQSTTTTAPPTTLAPTTTSTTSTTTTSTSTTTTTEVPEKGPGKRDKDKPGDNDDDD